MIMSAKRRREYLTRISARVMFGMGYVSYIVRYAR
jgi:hypothetical protein